LLVLLCEGTNDVIFLKEVLRTYCGFSSYSIEEKAGGFNKLTRILKTESTFKDLEEKYQAIIYGDRGKENLIRIIPNFIYLFTGTVLVNFNTLVVLDDDHIEAQKILEKVIKRIHCRDLREINISQRVLSERLLLVEAVSAVDDRYRLEMRIFLIPGSLEERLCHLFVEALPRRNRLRNNLVNMSPHKCLDEIISRGICSVSSKEDLIKLLIDKKLLDNEPWFQQLLKELCRHKQSD